jgi:hypothetical protein
MVRLWAFRVTVAGAVALTAWVKSSSVVLAGQTPAVARASAVGAPRATPSAPSQTEGRGGRRGGGPIPFEDRNGFRQIFNGTSLDGWDGDSTFWRVENGAIVGESTTEKPVTQNTFLIWSGGEPADFDLKLEFRISSTNSGVQYRSERLPEGGADKLGKWVLKGYQADIDFNSQYTGMLYEERGRAFLAPRGTFGYAGPASGPSGGPRGQAGALESSDALRAYIKQNDWNQFQVIARGNVLIHVLNGHVTALFVDDDPVGRRMKGLLGFQIHTGAPMKVEFRHVYLKTL